jgi:hypothetical protein
VWSDGSYISSKKALGGLPPNAFLEEIYVLLSDSASRTHNYFVLSLKKDPSAFSRFSD